MKKMVRWALCLALIFPFTIPSSAADKMAVAVLPFAVNSAENIDYVRQGVWVMLSSRIAVPDKIDVISREAVSAELKSTAAKELTSDDVLAIGKRLGAHYVVWGSITKIGNNVSIDGKMTNIATSKSTVSLFTQTEGMNDLIPKVNDFAQRIHRNILGLPETALPATTAPAPAKMDPVPSTGQSAANSREAEIVAGMKAGKKGTYTSIINPDFINASQYSGRLGQPIDRKGFWMSAALQGEFIGMDIGDVNGDGLNETVAMTKSDVTIFLKKGDSFKTLQTIKGNHRGQNISLDVADINRNGVPEIIVSSHNGNQVSSYVIEYVKGSFVNIAEDLPWFMRVVPSASGPILMGQHQGLDAPFNTPIHEIIWADGKYKLGKRLQLPYGLPVYGTTFADIGIGGEKVLSLDNYDALCIYDQTTKNLERIEVLFGGKELLWKTNENYGGSNNYLDLSRTQSQSKSTEDFGVYINLRILTYDTNKDGKKEIIIVKNASPTGGYFSRIKFYTSSEIINLEWDGLSLLENWRTRKINGYVADYQLKDMDNDGENEVVLLVVVSMGPMSRGKYALVSYKLTSQ